MHKLTINWHNLFNLKGLKKTPNDPENTEKSKSTFFFLFSDRTAKTIELVAVGFSLREETP